MLSTLGTRRARCSDYGDDEPTEHNELAEPAEHDEDAEPAKNDEDTLPAEHAEDDEPIEQGKQAEHAGHAPSMLQGLR